MKKEISSLCANARQFIFIFVGVSLPLACTLLLATPSFVIAGSDPQSYISTNPYSTPCHSRTPSCHSREGGNPECISTNPKEEESVIKLNGVLEVGFDINDKVNKGTTEYNKIGYGQIGISARPAKKLRAEFNLEYDKKDSAFIVDKLYAQYNFANWGGARIGYMKKSFGLEEGAGLEERYFHKRSIINDDLEYFGFLEHDLTFQYRHEFSKKWKATAGISMPKDTTKYDYIQNYSLEYDSKITNIILNAIIGQYANPSKYNTAFATSLSFKHSAKISESEAEITFANNPYIEFEKNERTFALGARVQEKFPIEIPTKILTQIVPIAEAAFWTDDLDKDKADIQLRAGLTFGFTKKSALQWRNTYGVISRFENGSRELRRRRFDSEAVVVF